MKYNHILQMYDLNLGHFDIITLGSNNLLKVFQILKMIKQKSEIKMCFLLYHQRNHKKYRQTLQMN